MENRRDSADTASRHWTRIDDYVAGMRWRSSAHRRRNRRPPGHHAEPEQLLLGMVPFLIVIAGLAVIACAIFVTALPGGLSESRAKPAQRELGTAPPGWIDG